MNWRTTSQRLHEEDMETAVAKRADRASSAVEFIGAVADDRADGATDRDVVATGGINRCPAGEHSATIAGGDRGVGEIAGEKGGSRFYRTWMRHYWPSLGTGGLHGKQCGYNENSYIFRNRELKKEIPV